MEARCSALLLSSAGCPNGLGGSSDAVGCTHTATRKCPSPLVCRTPASLAASGSVCMDA